MNYYILIISIIIILFIILFYFKHHNYKNKLNFIDVEEEINKNIKINLDNYSKYSNSNNNYITNKNNLNNLNNLNDLNNVDTLNKLNNLNNLNNPLNYDNKTDNFNAMKKCQVPTLNTEQCYKSREYECPIVNGTYLQCTNNYIPKPKEYNADCGNRTFDMVPYPWKISENCYYNNIGFNREKEFKKVTFV